MLWSTGTWTTRRGGQGMPDKLKLLCFNFIKAFIHISKMNQWKHNSTIFMMTELLKCAFDRLLCRIWKTKIINFSDWNYKHTHNNFISKMYFFNCQNSNNASKMNREKHNSTILYNDRIAQMCLLSIFAGYKPDDLNYFWLNF